MEPFAGVVVLTFTGLIVIFSALKWRWMAFPLTLAFALRTALALVNCYVVSLPDSQADARTFVLFAEEWAQKPIELNFMDDTSYFISWIISMLYRFVGVDLLAAHALSVLTGTSAVLLGGQLAYALWQEVRLARIATWWMAIFPTLNLYSALTLRESYVWLSLTVALLGVVMALRGSTILGVGLAGIGFAFATLFHGGMIVGAFALVLILGVHSMLRTLQLGWRQRIAPSAIFWLVVAGSALVAFFSINPTLPKLGRLEQTLTTDALIQSSVYAFEGGASYPAWLLPNSPIDLILKLPIRLAYFLFAPFPWDVRSPHHIVGLIDSLLYLYLFWLLWRGRHALLSNITSRWMLIVLAVIVLTFSLGTGNFGTGIRHRAKITIPLMTLAVVGYRKLTELPSRRTPITILRRT